MPRRTRRAPVRRRRRRRFTGRISHMRSLGIPGGSDALRVKLMYADSYTFTGSLAQTYVWRANALFDPDFTGSGHQPRGFDQYGAIWLRYYVYACKCELFVTNNGSVPCTVMLNATAQNTASYSTPDQACELANTVSGIVGVGTGMNSRKLSMTRTTDQMFGFPTAFDGNFSQLVTAIPARLWYYKFAVDTMAPSQAKDIAFQVKLTFYVRFTEREILPLS